MSKNKCRHCDLTEIPTKLLVGELVRRDARCFSWEVEKGASYSIAIDGGDYDEGFGFIQKGPATIIATYDEEDDDEGDEPVAKGGGDKDE